MSFLARVWETSIARSQRWHGEKGVHDWSLMEWCAAMCGEAGEAANVAKKIRHIESGMTNPNGWKSAQSLEQLQAAFLEECVDTHAYMVLALARQGVTAEQFEAAYIQKFNEVSIKCGFPERL